MKTNYKKEAERWEEKYWDEKNKLPLEGVLIGLIFSFIFISFFFFMFGVFDSPLDELDIDKDKLAGDYVLELYPEFESCSFEYNSCIELPCEAGVKVYCSDLENRDGLKISKDEVTEKIVFDGITLEEIFENKINKLSIKS